MTDQEREAAIVLAGDAMKAAQARYEATGCFGDNGEAHGHRLRMETLIRGRSRAQVKQMELERGLACA